MGKLSIKDLDLKDKTVFIRVDFNVPLSNNGKEISSDKRIRANAQEFLDVLATARKRATTRDEEKRELLRLVADDLPDEERASRAIRFLPAMPVLYADSLKLLVRESDEYVASLAAYHALESGTESVRQDVLAVYKARPSLSAIGWLAAAFAPRAAEAVGG